MIPRRKIHIQRGEFLLALKHIFLRTDTGKDYITDWEKEFADFIGVKHAISLGSGRYGMELILRCLHLKAGDEVVIPAYTLKALADVIESVGLKAVPADIDPGTFNSGPESIRRVITGRTKVIIATHLFGNPCRIDKIRDVAKENNICVLEDCAHSLGAQIFGKQTGSLSDVSFFSFETIKLINTYGGGIVATDNDLLAAKIRSSVIKAPRFVPFKKVIVSLIQNSFLPSPLSYPLLCLLASPGSNNRIYKIYRKTQGALAHKMAFGGFQARIGIEKLSFLMHRVSERRRKAELFISVLDGYVKPQVVHTEARHNYYFLVVLVDKNPKKLRRFLLDKGIDAGVGSEIADNWAEAAGISCPHAARVYNSSVQLPLYEELPDEKVIYIAESMKEFLR